MNLRQGTTLLDRLVESLRARGGALDGEAAPAAILWTDPEREWERVVALARKRLPELLVLGPYRPGARTGPAIWLRCVVDGGGDCECDRAPILYLPGVGRQDLRAGEDCREELKPLVELLHRGTAWRHPNGKDWTAAGFVGSSRGAGLKLAEDRGSARALRQALPEVALTPLARLRGRRLEADDFERLLVADLPRNLLRWLGDPARTRDRLEDRWDAFRSQCRKDLEFDPGSEPDVVAGKRLAEDPGWEQVRECFGDAPTAFPGVESLLRRSRPAGQLITGNPERWPQENDRREASLRDELAGLTRLAHPAACDRVARLEEEHGCRRGWIWAKLGRSPLAAALEPLARLAGAAKSPLGGSDPEDVAAAYLERGWGADAAAWEAVAAAGGVGDEKVVSAAVGHLLGPWLGDSARAFQEAVRRKPLPEAGGQPVVEAGEDGCLFFVDGLRYDLGRRLAERLETRGLRATVDTRWAALPTVTATAKPAVTPVAPVLGGDTLDETFAPRFRSGGRVADAKSLRAAMEERGYQILGGGAFDAPRSAAARGWCETGEIDKTGHREGEGLARRIPEALDRLAERIASLLESGWRTVRVVTDHGWLLLPGGLPKVDLPKHLTETRWARCAVLAGASDPEVPRWRWSWNAGEWFAAAPGIACFNQTPAFAHGGLSVQECLTPDLLVEREGGSAAPASIESVSWRRFRCHLAVSGGGEGWTADLRLGGPGGESAVQKPKPVDADGSVSLVLAGDEHEDAALAAVVMDGEGRVLAQRETRVGEDS